MLAKEDIASADTEIVAELFASVVKKLERTLTVLPMFFTYSRGIECIPGRERACHP